MTFRLPIDPQTVEAFCKRHHVRTLSLFGSFLKGTAKEGSDVDILVEFEPSAEPTLFVLAQMEEELSRLLGKRADVRTPAELSRHFRDDVLREAEVQYAAE
jgi:predicted nucleotidyltransferase